MPPAEAREPVATPSDAELVAIGDSFAVFAAAGERDADPLALDAL